MSSDPVQATGITTTIFQNSHKCSKEKSNILLLKCRRAEKEERQKENCEMLCSTHNRAKGNKY